ncbi:MAG: hypothetical protein ABJF86_16340 [Tateyamaria sp.]|uniref:hypothetical protein n=2 Tax=Tateyamaria sp. TaxID=1929288 RepID=UPI00327A9880
MNADISVKASETGAIRVFALSMTDAEAAEFKGDAASIATALGVEVDATHVEVFPVSDLEGIGLSGYLTEGNAIPPEELASDRPKLDRLGGWVMIVFSRAFQGRAVTLSPIPTLTLIGTYGMPAVDWRATEVVSSEAAKPFTAPPSTVKKRPSDAAMSGRIATVVLILLGLFTWAIIWIAG